MALDLKRLFNVGELTSAQREQVLDAARAIAIAASDEALKNHITQDLEHEAHVRDLEKTYAATKSSKAQYVPELYTLDPVLDRQVTGVHGTIKILSESVHEDPQIPEKAGALLKEAFPLGVRAIIGQSFPEQNRLVKDLVIKLQGEHAGLVSDLGLTGLITALAALSARYDEIVKRSPASVAWSTLQEASARAHGRMLEVLGRVIGIHFDSSDPVHLEARGAVLAVLFRELDTAAERRRARQAARRRRRRDQDGAGAPQDDHDVDDEDAIDEAAVAGDPAERA